jgi:hypothetical protein
VVAKVELEVQVELVVVVLDLVQGRERQEPRTQAAVVVVGGLTPNMAVLVVPV